MSAKSARQLVAELATCVTCGKEHEQRQIGPKRHTWAARDGHHYRSKLFELTGRSSAGFLQMLREMAS